MPPRSVAELNQWLTDLAVESGHPEKGRALRKNLATAIIAQMLPKDAYLKGGSAISLRYSLAESRLSRDVDSVFRGAKEIAFQMLVSASSPASVGFDYMLMPRTRARCG